MDFTNVSQNYEAGTKVLASQFVFGLSRKTQWLSGLYYADFISFYSPTQLCGGGTTKSNSNELLISVPLSFLYQIIGFFTVTIIVFLRYNQVI